MRPAAAVVFWMLGALIFLVGCGGSAPKPARAAVAHSSASRHGSRGRPPAPFIDPHNIYAADGRLMLVSCEFGSAMIVIDVAHERVVRTIKLRAGAKPQDVSLSPGGRVFFVADLAYGGVWEIAASRFGLIGFLRTGAGAHGLYPSRDARFLYVSNRTAGTVSVIRFATR